MRALYPKILRMSLADMQISAHLETMSRPAQLFPYFANVRTLNGVGDKTGEALARAMGERLRDLILTPPNSLIDRSYRPGIAGAIAGDIATFKVTVGSHVVPTNKSRPYRVRVFDETGDMMLVYFNFIRSRQGCRKRRRAKQ